MIQGHETHMPSMPGDLQCDIWISRALFNRVAAPSKEWVIQGVDDKRLKADLLESVLSYTCSIPHSESAQVESLALAGLVGDLGIGNDMHPRSDETLGRCREREVESRAGT